MNLNEIVKNDLMEMKMSSYSLPKRSSLWSANLKKMFGKLAQTVSGLN